MEAKKLTLMELNRMDVETFKSIKKNPINIILDDIRSALNVGSFFRTCDALAINHLYLCGITAKPPHKEILKTAIGATNSVSWSYHETVEDAISIIGEDSTICSIEQTDASISLENIKKHPFNSKSSVTLIFGNEVNGVGKEAISRSDLCVEIPQFGTKHSFNVSVCGGIVIWEFWKAINKK